MPKTLLQCIMHSSTPSELHNTFDYRVLQEISMELSAHCLRHTKEHCVVEVGKHRAL